MEVKDLVKEALKELLNDGSLEVMIVSILQEIEFVHIKLPIPTH